MSEHSIHVNTGIGQEGLLDRPQALLESFLRNARERPLAPSLAWNGDVVSYGQLHAMASRALAEIRSLELAEQDTVAILAPKSPSAIALILACLVARLRILLPPVDLAERTLRALFQEVDCKQVLAPKNGLDMNSVELVDRVVSADPGSVDPAWPSVDPSPADVCFMLTTSGSTGLPKIVPLTTGAVDRFTEWASNHFEIGAGRTVLNYAPLNFDLCLLDIWATLKSGGCVVLVDPKRAADARYLLGLLDVHEVHLVQAVPMFYQLVVEAARNSGQRFEAAGHVIFTGDSIPLPCLEELPRLFTGARLYNIYGCTETNDSFIHEVDRSVPPQAPVPIGRPLPGVDVLIVDENGAVIEGAGQGELLVSTPFQTRGYTDHVLNDRAFVDHPQGRSSLRYFRTGDLVRVHADGTFTLEGRRDYHVKVRGVRVNMQEVERVLLEHGQVVEAAVVAVPDALAGHQLHALVRRARASDLNSLVLRRHCAERLRRASIPSTLRIVQDPLPRTSTGKVDHNVIARMQTKEQ